jgi:hypothetical protein
MIAAALAGLLAGILLTALFCRLVVVPRVRARAYDVCQAQALRDGWHPAVCADGFNGSNVPRQHNRRRSPDTQDEPFIARQMARTFDRPVFDAPDR